MRKLIKEKGKGSFVLLSTIAFMVLAILLKFITIILCMFGFIEEDIKIISTLSGFICRIFYYLSSWPTILLVGEQENFWIWLWRDAFGWGILGLLASIVLLLIKKDRKNNPIKKENGN